MEKWFKRFITVALIAILALGMVACGGSKSGTSSENKGAPSGGAAPAEKKFKVAMLLSGSINDGGWNTNAYNGLQEIQQKLGVETAFTENVKKNDQVQIMREYARKGFDVIIGHGFEFSDALKQVSEEYPKVMFAGVGTNVTAPGVASLQFTPGELGYLAGIVAAHSTKVNKIGIVTATKDPTGQVEFDNIKERVAKINPQASVVIAYTGSWDDVNKAKEAALAQIASGVDVIVADNDAGNLGVIQAAQEQKDKKVKVIGWTGDYYDQAPDVILTSAVQKISTLIFTGVKDFKEGKFKGQIYRFGLKEKAQYMGKYSDAVPQSVKDEVTKATEDLISGKIKPIGNL
ncbi:BMP family protein [Moorella naiadis]|uniref:BMP family protein n=1 Tax=Moorella naiadis (nom. illeg.) TaxID=3093670 RepID=UPI003D9C8FA9